MKPEIIPAHNNCAKKRSRCGRRVRKLTVLQELARVDDYMFYALMNIGGNMNAQTTCNRRKYGEH